MVSVGNAIFGNADIVHNAYNVLCSFKLTPGTHLIISNVTFASNDIGIRRIGLSSDGKSFHINRLAVKVEQAVSGFDTMVRLSFIYTTTKEDTLYLMTQQNSGITLSCIYGISVLSVENAKRYTIPYEYLNTIH